MKILIIEDNDVKRWHLKAFFNQLNIDLVFESSLASAVECLNNNHNKISGIILDLELSSYDGADDYDLKRGIDFVIKLAKEEVNIPILINSRAKIVPIKKLIDENPNVKGQMYFMNNYSKISSFINSLEEKEDKQ